MDGIVYAYRNKINGKHYIGQTVHPDKRHRDHMAGRFGHCWKFGSAVKKHGPDSFAYEVLVDKVPREDLNDWERFFIWQFHAFTHGYNLTTGGDFDRATHSDPGFKARKAEGIRRAWTKPGYKEAMAAKLKEAHNRPEAVAKKRQSQKSTMARPDVKQKHRASTTAAQRKITLRLSRSKPIICIETGQWFMNTYEVKRLLGHDNGSINRVCNGIKKHCGGYSWRFATEEETKEALRRINE